MIGNIFRRLFEDALDKLPFQTESGQVDEGKADFPSMGHPGGTHSIGRLWRYLRNDTNLQMYFGFYNNFTPDDLICKVFSSWDELRPGMGASVQFNADHCIKGEGTMSYLCHHGKVTIGVAISRSNLVSRIKQICPREMNIAGILGKWPVRIGYATSIPGLID